MAIEKEKRSEDNKRGSLIAIDKNLIACDRKRVLGRHRGNIWRWASIRKQVSWAGNRRLEPTLIPQPFQATMLGKLFSVDRQYDIQPDPLRLDHLESALRASRSSRMTRLAISICRSSSGS
jgi:hypothetical protein